MKKYAIIFAGCGVYDGTEIHEAVITMLNIKKYGSKYNCFAPDRAQYHVIDHLKEEPDEEVNRNILVESARIARSDIKNIIDYKPQDFDGLLIPGGFGVAKSLFTYAVDGFQCAIQDDIKNVIINTHGYGKPIGAMCISPLLVVRAFQDTEVEPIVTLGNDPVLAKAVKDMGGIHKTCNVKDICYDEKNKIVTTPAYTLADDITEVAEGIEKLVYKIIEIS
jgi:enhancing lycopene biosynthesis protein 2